MIATARAAEAPKRPPRARAKGPPRLQVLAAADSRAHRYMLRRRIAQLATVAVLFAVPASRLARFDAWHGRSYALGRAVDGVTGMGALAVAIVGFYFVTFALNAVLGRIFCGWGCPIGELSRLGDERAVAWSRGRGRARALGWSLGYTVALTAAVLSWWVDPAVLYSGSGRAIATTLGVWLALVVAALLHGRFWRWDFCRHACPIGLYYSIVQTHHRFGVHFHAELDSCIDCGKCDDICPVRLPPRELGRAITDIGGLSIDGMPGQNHCLTCGDCVRACELVLKHEPRARIPLKLGVRPSVDSRSPS